MMMSYAGLRNGRLVELLQRHGVNAVGLSGVDGAGRPGPPQPRHPGQRRQAQALVRDLSGKPKAINRELLDLLLATATRRC